MEQIEPSEVDTTQGIPATASKARPLQDTSAIKPCRLTGRSIGRHVTDDERPPWIRPRFSRSVRLLIVQTVTKHTRSVAKRDLPRALSTARDACGSHSTQRSLSCDSPPPPLSGFVPLYRPPAPSSGPLRALLPTRFPSHANPYRASPLCVFAPRPASNAWCFIW